MLTELCAELKNYFIHSLDDIHAGEYTISGGSIDLPFLTAGQYFRISGSLFNDGVWQYGSENLTDEGFVGTIWAMSVPPAVVDLSDRIDRWNEENAVTLNSPYSSESFGGYSYTKGKSASSNGSGAYTWKEQFAGELKKYRRIQPVL